MLAGQMFGESGADSNLLSLLFNVISAFRRAIHFINGEDRLGTVSNIPKMKSKISETTQWLVHPSVGAMQGAPQASGESHPLRVITSSCLIRKRIAAHLPHIGLIIWEDNVLVLAS